MKIDLKNTTTIVTGSNGYLGKEIIDTILKLNGKVIAIDINKSIKKNSNKYKFYQIDLSDPPEISAFFQTITKENKKIDYLINNAALSFKGNYLNRKRVEIEKTMSVNLMGVFFMIKEFSKYCKKNSSIVNLASIYGIISPKPEYYYKNKIDNSEIYGATKAGIIQFTKYFARYLSNKKIRVNSVSPGGIYNNNAPQDKYFIKKYIDDVPLNRLADKKDIVPAIIFLLSEYSSYINGQNIIIDGGKSC